MNTDTLVPGEPTEKPSIKPEITTTHEYEIKARLLALPLLAVPLEQRYSDGRRRYCSLALATAKSPNPSYSITQYSTKKN